MAEPEAPEPSRLEQLVTRVLGDADEVRFGTGWMSGTASVFLGGLAVLGVLAFWFPGRLSTPDLRNLYPVGALRVALALAIALAFVLGAVSVMLRRRKVLGTTGMALALTATLLGGGDVPIESRFEQRVTVGVDWFVLNVLLLALVFVPLERALPRRPEQTTFRFGWTTDGLHFLMSHLGVQALTFATLLPSVALGGLAQSPALARAVSAQPLWAQLGEIVVVTDLTQYWVHRAFHRVPWLWRFHAVHHSSRALDWLAGSRLHLVDAVVTRGLVMVPVVLLGFAAPALYAYLVLVSFHAVFVHANVRFRPGWLDHVIATPRVHHWHHALAPIDRNFAVQLPVIDRLFGTQHLPGDAWPDRYGTDGAPMPEGWWAQLIRPFRR